MSQQSHPEESRPDIPKSGVAYGETIYWGTIASAVVTILGQVLTFLTPGSAISPSILLSRIWDGKGVEGIWKGVGVARPANEHWYFAQITTGEGLTMFGIAVGVFVVIPALLASAWVLLTREGRPLFGVLAIIAALITLASFVGVIQMPVG
ncbi:hypothetical protein [Thiohalorhabdus sp.]|uniref:hypothetical protein n=1 Tax=Thiohalorhabdus sp. TaxID=3094134 RepID=UPI002FC2A9D4